MSLEDREQSADLTGVQADDALLNEIAQGRQPTSEELVWILAKWRSVVDSEPPTREFVDIGTAQAAIRAGSRGGRRWFRQWMRFLIRWRRH